jgi:hypothetical protein
MSLALRRLFNEIIYENFRMVTEEFYGDRKDLHALRAITLLTISVDCFEVECRAKFIVEPDPDIHYKLLIVHT